MVVPAEFKFVNWITGTPVPIDDAMTSALTATVDPALLAAFNALVNSSVVIPPIFECRLDYVGTTSVRLNRFNGNYLTIEGSLTEIPSAGVDLDNSGVSNSTTYYVYAYLSSGTLTLELSTTAYAIDSTYGYPIKNGDATRSLVGKVRTTAAGIFADSTTQRFVISYYNRKGLLISGTVTGAVNITSAPFVEISSTGRTEAIVWDGVVPYGSIQQCASSVAGSAFYGGLGYGTTLGTISTTDATSFGASPAINDRINVGAAWNINFSENYYFFTLVGGRDSGTATYQNGYNKYTMVILG